MDTYVNEWSARRTPIAGMRLAPGATLHAGDFYNSTDGSWREAGWGVGLVIQPGCQTVWVRPNATLSNESIAVLAKLVRGGDHHFYLTQHSRRWKLVPTPSSVVDGRMDWSLLHQEAAQPLIDHGFVTEVPGYAPPFGDPYPMYYPSAIGIELIRKLRTSH